MISTISKSTCPKECFFIRVELSNLSKLTFYLEQRFSGLKHIQMFRDITCILRRKFKKKDFQTIRFRGSMIVGFTLKIYNFCILALILAVYSILMPSQKESILGVRFNNKDQF